MGASTLGSRAIIGRFYKTLEQDLGAGWLDPLSMYFNSDQASEEYKWLGQTPAMREWVGGRHAKGFRENGLTIVNKRFEATLEVLLDDLRRDKTGQVLVRIDELAQRTNAHWASLLSTLITNGESAVCYDGQYFFDTDHSEGDSGAQSNDISVNISTTTAPTAGEFEGAILEATQKMLSFKDDQGEPMNENARRFLIMVPVPFLGAAAAALQSQVIVQNATAVASNRIMAVASLGGFTYDLVANARLTWTEKFALFRGDGGVKPFIRQEEEAVQLKAKAEGSEFEFDNRAHQYGVDTSRNVGYGYWQHGCLVTFT